VFGAAYRYQDLNVEQQRRNPNWTEEEAEVQRILSNLRGQGAVGAPGAGAE
jgi:hypothetical protein